MLRRLCWWLIVLVLASCRTVPVSVHEPVVQSWDAHCALLQARDRFDLKGRVAVAVGNEGFNANLHWTQNGQQTRMTLDGPLGAGGVEVTSKGSNLSIVTSHGEHLEDDAARAELASRLGFDPPLESMRYWILGVPEPTHPAQSSLDTQQRLTTLQQNGWQIQYSSYTIARGDWLPARLTLQREGVRVRVVVDVWNS